METFGEVRIESTLRRVSGSTSVMTLGVPPPVQQPWSFIAQSGIELNTVSLISSSFASWRSPPLGELNFLSGYVHGGTWVVWLLFKVGADKRVCCAFFFFFFFACSSVYPFSLQIQLSFFNISSAMFPFSFDFVFTANSQECWPA